MKLTSRSEYTLLALVYLARHETEEYISVDAVATAQGIPPKFLEQILLAMKRAHLLRSTKGQHGGYHLAKAPNQISLAEVIRLFVGRVFSMPLAWLAKRDNRLEFLRSETGHSVITFLPFDGELLWGATARMTVDFVKALGLEWSDLDKIPGNRDEHIDKPPVSA